MLGSKYYSLHPTFAPGKIAANINYDGGNYRGRTKDLTQIGTGKSSLDAIAKALVEQQGRVLVPDQFPDKGYFYRSDQFSLREDRRARAVLRQWLRLHRQARGLGQAASTRSGPSTSTTSPATRSTTTWVFDGMIEDATIGFEAGWLVAQADEMPTWNPGDEFEAARKKALAE